MFDASGNACEPGTLALIALGSNLGDPARNIDLGLRLLGDASGVEILRKSSLYQTRPVGGPAGQPLFANGATLVRTTLEPIALLRLLLAIERELRRVRIEFWGPRSLDLDLICYGSLVLSTSELTLPHPRFFWREFVLDPICEIAPDFWVPTLRLTMREIRNLLRANLGFSTLLTSSLARIAANDPILTFGRSS